MKGLLVDQVGAFELVLRGPRGHERLKILGDYPKLDCATGLFNGLGTMHLIAPYFPKTIVTNNFKIAEEISFLIGDMYQSEKQNLPKFFLTLADLPSGHYLEWDEDTVFESGRTERRRRSNRTRLLNSQLRQLGCSRPSSKRVAVAYSAGKDSMWNMGWAQERYGAENVLCVHISGLNRCNVSRERSYSEAQARKLGFKNFRVIELLNSSRNTGYATMRSRDMFLAGVIAPVALEFGASQIITEGFAEESSEEPYTGQEKNMRFFNNMLSAMRVPVRVAWRNAKEMDIIRDLILNRPDWLPTVCNCFAAPCYRPMLRRSWKKRAPTFPLYDSQCGSCVKCRIVNLARVLHDPALQKTRRADIRTFLDSTSSWLATNRERLADYVVGSFERDFNRATKIFKPH